VKLLIDLDDTLVNTTSLNNDAYNYALEKFGFNRINKNERITREILNINDKNSLKYVIREKQKYFMSRWLSYRTVINHELINKIREHKNIDCFLWTKANELRVVKTLESCELTKYFKDIIYDNKTSFDNSVFKFRTLFDDKQILIYENNHNFFNQPKCEIIDEIKTQYFDIKGYKISI